MSAPLVFLDTETTGVNPARNDVWEIGLIFRDGDEERVYQAQVWPDLRAADPTGLRISRFYDRELMSTKRVGRNVTTWPAVLIDPNDPENLVPTTPEQVAWDLTVFLDGAHIIGAVPSFDAAFLERFLHRHAHAATWHYHLIDVENVAVGYLAAKGISLMPPYDSQDLSTMCDVPLPTAEERHTALGDARWVMRWWDRMTNPPPSKTRRPRPRTVES